MAHPDLDQLLNALLAFAKQTLSKNKEFYPFGSSIDFDGKIIFNAAYDGNEHPKSQQIIDLLTDAFRQKAILGEIRAAGICYDIRTIPPGEKKKTDAICVSLEHQSGEAVDVYIPYNKLFLGKIAFGELYAAHRTPQFFISKTTV
jgi:hypothetical protein